MGTILPTDLFTDILECTLPIFIEHRWDTLDGLQSPMFEVFQF